MNRWLASTLAVAALWAFASTVQAQQIGTYTPPTVNPRPTVSPYLNMTRGGIGTGAINYYGIVRPQLDTQRNLLQLQQEYKGLQGLQQQQTDDPTTGTLNAQVPTQGFGGFFFYGHYYPLLNRQGGGVIAGQAGGIRR